MTMLPVVFLAKTRRVLATICRAQEARLDRHGW